MFVKLRNSLLCIKIRWEYNGEELQQSSVGRFKISNTDTVHKLALTNVDPTFSGRYTLIAENPMGVAACSAMLTVRRYEVRIITDYLLRVRCPRYSGISILALFRLCSYLRLWGIGTLMHALKFVF